MILHSVEMLDDGVLLWFADNFEAGDIIAPTMNLLHQFTVQRGSPWEGTIISANNKQKLNPEYLESGISWRKIGSPIENLEKGTGNFVEY